MRRDFFKFFIIAYSFLLLLIHPCYSLSKEYDGLWFMGFNLHKDVFSDVRVRQAINYAIDRKFIANRIMSEEVVPNGVIPPGMSGYNPKFLDYDYNVAKARKLLKAAKFVGGNLVLLHTDGVKTIQIAQTIQKNLSDVGIKVSLKQVAYSDQEKWQAELKSGRHHLFLMGYKTTKMENIYIGDKISKIFHMVGCNGIPSPDNQIIFGTYEEATAAGYLPDPICKPQPTEKADTYDLLNPLFYSQGSANFTFYSNDRVDALLDQISQIDPALTALRARKYSEINRLLVLDAPTVNLFYISKL